MAADRQDIDALLIGALYGELDGAERTRLEAHLASHPQDRSALEGMRSTRELLRDAELTRMLGAAEPPPAVSARLLQEAARRAPVPATGGVVAFLLGLFRPFVASPALSAATAMVLVGGAAGLMYARGTFDAAEPRVSGRDSTAQIEARTAPPGTEPGTAQLAPSPLGTDDYRVTLDENQVAGDGTVVGGNFEDSAKRGLAKDGKLGEAGALETASGKEAGNDQLAFQAELKAKAAKKVATGAKGDAAGRPGYLTIEPTSADAPTVLSLDGLARSDDDASENERKNAPAASDKSRAGGGGSGAAIAEGRAPADAAPPPAAGAAPQKPATIARDQGKAGAVHDPAAAAALDGWARDQHTRMVKLVNQGKCTDAGAIGADIARKAPDYYAANVANDRQVRSCRSYVDRARRAKSEDAKTKAAAPRSPAPAPQQDMESTQ